MHQLTQKLKDGETKIIEVPFPQMGPRMLLVRNHYSVISAGTEGATANSARKSLLAKAKERPEQVRQVLDVLKKQGPVQTYRAVTKKLEAYSPCGYSSAGEVLDVGSDVSGFAPGDKVACAGAGYASHAEIIAVPVNLCVRLAPSADLADAAYNTLGAIALQGVRQAELKLGESVLIIGLGLIGQIAAQLCRASGCRVIGVDVSQRAVDSASSYVDMGLTRSTAGLEQRIADFTGGIGVDAVIIAAATSSLDPVNFAGVTARRKAVVVILGAVPTGFDRENYYKKELALKMSCSYGPGRYDLDYEEKGLDYPVEYVRWTEKRNMEAFQQLLLDKRVDVKGLTTHQFAFEDAPKAYDMIVTRSEPFTGIVLKYDIERPLHAGKVTLAKTANFAGAASVGVAFIGAGSYAQGNLLPNLDGVDGVSRVTVLTNSGTTSRRVAERFGFTSCTDNEDDIFTDSSVNTVFIATRHDSHAEYTVKALTHGKNVFVEKPLAMTVDELQAIEAAYQASGKQLLVGFNRRFAPLAVRMKQILGKGVMSMIYRVNAGKIPADTWIQDTELGGGRIVGEGCHFIDFMTWICGSLPVKVYATALPDAAGCNDTVNIAIEFANGSIGLLAYYANGAKDLPKEYFEAHHAGASVILRDFRELEWYSPRKKRDKRWSQDKGQAAMVAAFLQAIKSGGPALIPFAELKATTLASFAAMESLRQKTPVALVEDK
jgi:predicted dehydrogenase/threonine dehydrogenase-like Zn-dependent dehydrogenase